MNPKIRIASSVVSVGLALACALPSQAAAGTLLSGYGGPGAGEQAVIGSTLLNPPRGGPGGATGSTSLPTTGTGLQAGSPGTVPGSSSRASGSSSRASRIGSGSASSSGSKEALSGQQRGVRSGSEAGQDKGDGAYVYPSALRSRPASPPLGISGGDLAVAVGILAALALLAALTIRAGRLQR